MTGTRRTRRRIVGNRKLLGRSGGGVIRGSRLRVLKHDERKIMRLGAILLDLAEVDAVVRELLRQALVATVTDPRDMALLPEYFPPTYRSIQ